MYVSNCSSSSNFADKGDSMLRKFLVHMFTIEIFSSAVDAVASITTRKELGYVSK